MNKYKGLKEILELSKGKIEGENIEAILDEEDLGELRELIESEDLVEKKYKLLKKVLKIMIDDMKLEGYLNGMSYSDVIKYYKKRLNIR